MGYISVKKANCKNCYKCLKFCDVKSISYIDDRVDVIADQCILCGHCVNVCPQKAKTVVNPTLSVLDALHDPQVKVIASLAPSYVGVYGLQNRRRLIAALLKLGFDGVEETSAGANEVTHQYRLLMDKGEMPCILTTCCPTVNTLITKYYPELVPFMAPVVSPVLAHGRMIKERMGPDTKVVFVGPCLSKIREIHEHPESADAAISFRRLDKMMADRGIRLEDMDEEEVPVSPYSRVYPIPEGILRDVAHQQGEEAHKIQDEHGYNGYTFMSVCGVQNVMQLLDELKKGRHEKIFIELNACEGGCVNGPLIPEERRGAYRGQLEIQSYTREPLRPEKAACPDLSLAFEAEPIHKDIPDEKTIRKILAEIGKPTPDKELNCGSCGYPTCRDKAIAVYQKKAELYMCLPYINDLSQSLSSVTLNVTPNYILAVDRDLRLLEMNLPAQKLFGVSRQQAIKGDLFEYMDPADFEEVLATHRNIVDKKVHLDQQNVIVMQTLVYVAEQDIVVGVMKDVTEEEKKKESAFKARLESAEMAQKVIEKQMIVAQEIASLLGETTAETKVTLNNLKSLILSEGTDHE